MDHTHRKNGGAALDIFPRTKRGGPENFRKQIQPGIDTPGVGPPNGDPPGVWSPGVGPPGIIGVATWEWDMVTGMCRYSPE